MTIKLTHDGPEMEEAPPCQHPRLPYMESIPRKEPKNYTVGNDPGDETEEEDSIGISD